MDIFRPSSLAPLSTLAISAHCSANLSKSFRPMSVWAISRPRKRTETFTRFPSVRNFCAFFSFTLKSPTSMPELSVVHKLAHRGIGLGGNFHQIHALLIGDAQRLVCGHNPQLLAAAADQAQLLVADVLIQLMCCNANNRSTSFNILNLRRRPETWADLLQRAGSFMARRRGPERSQQYAQILSQQTRTKQKARMPTRTRTNTLAPLPGRRLPYKPLHIRWR